MKVHLVDSKTFLTTNLAEGAKQNSPFDHDALKAVN